MSPTLFPSIPKITDHMSDPYTSGIPPVPPADPYTPPASDVTPQVDTTATIEIKITALLCHLFMVIGPLVVMFTRKDLSAYLDYHTKEALNFQITLLIAYIVSAVLIVILIGALLMPLVALAGVVLSLIGALSALEGKYYRYPFSLRIIK